MTISTLTRTVLVGLVLFCMTASLGIAQDARTGPKNQAEWHFIVSGDSRNCGDLVMPAIAADAMQFKPAFYWHLGDARAIYEIDEDYAGELGSDNKLRHWDLARYQDDAWDDFERMQIDQFETRGIPFVLGIGNHETIKPKTREQFVARFGKWLGDPSRAAERGNEHSPSAYYSWAQDGLEFIYLDNSTAEQFDDSQMRWLRTQLENAKSDATIRAVVVGMHKALPNSRSNFHSMSETPGGLQSGRCVYRELAALQSSKPVYLLASHSHFVLTDLYGTPSWKDVGIVPGILIGTAGAVRYRLPASAPQSNDDIVACIKNPHGACAKTDVYGYLLVTVNANGRPGALRFEFRQISEREVPPEVRSKFSPNTMDVCFKGNREMIPSVDTTQNLPDGPCPAY